MFEMKEILHIASSLLSLIQIDAKLLMMQRGSHIKKNYRVVGAKKS